MRAVLESVELVDAALDARMAVLTPHLDALFGLRGWMGQPRAAREVLILAHEPDAMGLLAVRRVAGREVTSSTSRIFALDADAASTVVPGAPDSLHAWMREAPAENEARIVWIQGAAQPVFVALMTSRGAHGLQLRLFKVDERGS
jgi:hypothetical protein